MIGDIRKFRFWCQKVLPLVYDNSLSYMELLCKVVDYLNKVIDDINSVPDYIDGVINERLSDEHLRELIDEFIVVYKHIITPNDDGTSPTATRSWDMGTWLWLDDVLYITTNDIVEGNAYVFTGDNANVRVITVDERVTNVYYPNDKKLSIHANISDYSQIVTEGDYHIYTPTREAIEIRKVE